MSTTIAFWLHFRVLGGLVGGSRGYLGHLGEKLGYLGRSWRQVGTLWQHVGGKMAKKSEDMRTWSEIGWLKGMKPARYAAAGGGLARVGRCLELEFRDLEKT